MCRGHPVIIEATLDKFQKFINDTVIHGQQELEKAVGLGLT